MPRCSILLAVLAALLILVPTASAAYPGRAGELVYADGNASSDPISNGTQTYLDSVFATAPGAPARTTALSCQGSDTGFAFGLQFCPLSAPRFTPDGSRMVVAGVRYGPDGGSTPAQLQCVNDNDCPDGLILADADGGNPALLPTGLADAQHPAFGADGKSVVFAGRTRVGGPLDVYAMPLDGAPRVRLTTTGADYPAPCADGGLLYVHRGDVYRTAAPGTTPVRLTRQGGATYPDCARDSRSFVFVRHSTLYAETITGRHLRRLSSPGVVTSAPALSPAGGRIAIATVRRCGPACGEVYPRCTNVRDRIEVLDLAGRRRASRVVGRNFCSADGNLGGDDISGVGWQPQP